MTTNNASQTQTPALIPAEKTVENVLTRISELQSNGNLMLPAGYSAENAVRSAWLVIQETKDLNESPALTVCTPASIANALLDMVLQGLSPVKKQCYFIVYGNKLQMQKSYFGQIAIGKRVAGVMEAVGVPIYEKDTFKYSIDIKTGTKTVTEHLQDFDNIDPAKLKGAYAVITYNDGRVEYEIMTMAQIRKSWEMGKAKGNSKAHINFPDQMAAKTVVNRALKLPVNSSDDSDLYDEEQRSKQVEADVKLQIAEHGNKEEIGFEEEETPAPVASVASITTESVKVETTSQEEPAKQQQAVQQKVPF